MAFKGHCMAIQACYGLYTCPTGQYNRLYSLYLAIVAHQAWAPICLAQPAAGFGIRIQRPQALLRKPLHGLHTSYGRANLRLVRFVRSVRVCRTAIAWPIGQQVGQKVNSIYSYTPCSPTYGWPIWFVCICMYIAQWAYVPSVLGLQVTLVFVPMRRTNLWLVRPIGIAYGQPYGLKSWLPQVQAYGPLCGHIVCDMGTRPTAFVPAQPWALLAFGQWPTYGLRHRPRQPAYFK